MIYILKGDTIDILHNNGDIRKLTITKYDDNKKENTFLTYNKQRNYFGIGKIDEKTAKKLMFRKKLSTLQFNEQVDINIKNRKGTLNKDEFIFKNIRSNNDSNIINYIEQKTKEVVQ